jgi:hypothetical protein
MHVFDTVYEIIHFEYGYAFSYQFKREILYFFKSHTRFARIISLSGCPVSGFKSLSCFNVHIDSGQIDCHMVFLRC